MPNVLEYPEGIRDQWNLKYFNNNNPLVLELGCGKGEYTLEMARRFPRKNFVGVDIKGARIWKGAGTALQEALKNVAFLRTGIEKLDDYFGNNEVSGVWITFPDPYPKKSKASKRLVSPRFLGIYRKVLQPGGQIHLKTDNGQLFEYALETLTDEKCQIHNYTRHLHRSELLNGITGIRTYYEQKMMEEEKATIKYACFSLPSK